MSYQDIKYAISDGICENITGLLPELLANSCSKLTDGLIVTTELMFITVLLGGALAILAAMGRISPRKWISYPVAVYSYVFRGTPLLVQLWFVYFGLGSLGEAGLGPLWPYMREGWWVGVIVLILNTGAYVSEILRGGLMNVPKGQIEAALAVGMTRMQIFRRVRFPLAVRTTLPAYGNEVILLLKSSALVSTITVMDLMGQTRTVFARSYNLEIYFHSAMLYLVLAGIITVLFHLVERRLKRSSVIS